MRIVLVGASCVGKTTVGKQLAKKIGYDFKDLYDEIEKQYNKPVYYIMQELMFPHSYEIAKANILKELLKKDNVVIALTPSGMCGSNKRVFKKYYNVLTIWLVDKPENIVERLEFYDNDTKLIPSLVNEKNKKQHIMEIKKEHTLYKYKNKDCDVTHDINGDSVDETVDKLIERVKKGNLKKGYKVKVIYEDCYRIIECKYDITLVDFCEDIIKSFYGSTSNFYDLKYKNKIWLCNEYKDENIEPFKNEEYMKLKKLNSFNLNINDTMKITYNCDTEFEFNIDILEIIEDYKLNHSRIIEGEGHGMIEDSCTLFDGKDDSFKIHEYLYNNHQEGFDIEFLNDYISGKEILK